MLVLESALLLFVSLSIHREGGGNGIRENYDVKITSTIVTITSTATIGHTTQ